MRSPVFVVGSGRSGTTLLRLMLDSHPMLAIPGESTFIRYLWMNRDYYWRRGQFQPRLLLKAILADPNFQRWEIPAERVWARVQLLETPSFSDIIAAPFEAYADSHGKSRWGDKTPNYVLSIREIAQLFPDASFVHVIRDGRNVALSYMSIPMFTGGIWAATWLWRDRVNAGLRAGKSLGPQRYLQIRYEDLVRNPERELRALCVFLNLEFSGDMLRYYLDAESRLQAPPDRVRFHENISAPPRPSLTDWRSEMPRDDLLIFESVAGDLLEEFGYERAFSEVSLGARTRGSVRLALHRLHLTASTVKKTASRSVRRLSARSWNPK